MLKVIKETKAKYIIFLVLVIACVSANLIVIQYNVNQQKFDAETVNLSGRQRMLSQRIIKLILFIQYHDNQDYKHYKLDTLRNLVKQWKYSNDLLPTINNDYGNDEAVDSLLKVNRPRINAIISATNAYINNPTPQQSATTLHAIEQIEMPFLQTMESTVLAFQKLAERNLEKLKLIELILTIISIFILLINFKYSILPVINELINKGSELSIANQRLTISEEEIKKNLEGLKVLREELEEKEKYNRIFIEEAPSAIAMFDNNMEYLAVSKKWIADYGLMGKEIIGKSHYEIFPEIGDDWKKIHQECLNGAINTCEEAEFTRADGSSQWISWDVRPWYTSQQKIGGIIMLTEDLTEVKIVEKEKDRITEILNKTNEIARIGTWEVDLLANKLTWSKITKEIHGVSPDFIPDLETAINFYREGKSREAIQKVVYEAIKNGKSFDVELEIVTKKNKMVWVRSIGQTEMKNGKCIKLYGIFQDINEIKLSEEKINRANAELNAILNSGPISIIATDIDGTITHFNQGAERLLQYSADEMIGKQTPAVIHLSSEIEERGKILSERYNKEISGFQVFVEEAKNGNYDLRQWTYIRKDRTTFQVELLVTALKNSKHEITGFLGVATDITERIEANNKLQRAKDSLEILAERLTNQNRQLASFAHITSHNLRSPVSNLNALLNFYKIAEDEEEKAMLFEKFEIVIEHLTLTLNTLIDALKIKEDNHQVLENISFEQILSKTKEILSGDIMETDAYIKHDFSKAPHVEYDISYLESIFLNLISNAIKYRAIDRTPEIFIETAVIDEKIVLKISDNGLGINLERHGDKLFGLNKTFHRNENAKGVGLYLTKTQIESMGGTITAQSEVNKGTTFIITF